MGIVRGLNRGLNRGVGGYSGATTVLVIAIDAGGPASGSYIADAYFTNTLGDVRVDAVTVDVTGITNPAPNDVYASQRFGLFRYDIPGLSVGVTYYVRLHFAENWYTTAGSRTFNATINGVQVLSNFDMLAAAGAQYKAVVRGFTAVADGSGVITIAFAQVVDWPQVNGIEVLSTLPPADSAPPTVTGHVPGTGGTDIATNAVVTATFSEAVRLSTIVFTLKDPGNNTVAATVTYSDTDFKATLTPSSSLANSTTYTASVSGATDWAGNAMSAPVTWTFATVAGVSSPTQVRLELITNNALVNSDAHNAWGGHKLRLIRLSNDVVYTTYQTARSPQDVNHQNFNIARRNSDTTWTVLYTGDAGREPCNILRGPADQIYHVSWPDGLPQLSTSTDGTNFTTVAVPGSWQNSTGPYSSASISPAGDLYVVQTGPWTTSNIYYIAYRMASDGIWHFTTLATDYRYAYAYVFAGNNGRLSILGLRDVPWGDLGWTQVGGFSYVFDGLRRFDVADIRVGGWTNFMVAEDVQTPAHEFVQTADRDVYIDTASTMHVNYDRVGADTGGVTRAQVALALNTSLISDVDLGLGRGNSSRMVQSPTNGRFYIFDSSSGGGIWDAGTVGNVLGTRTALNLSGYSIGDNGFFMACPRGGTPSSNTVDAAFMGGSGIWVYIRVMIP